MRAWRACACVHGERVRAWRACACVHGERVRACMASVCVRAWRACACVASVCVRAGVCTHRTPRQTHKVPSSMHTPSASKGSYGQRVLSYQFVLSDWRALGSSDLTGLQAFGAYLCLYNLSCIVVHAYSLYVRVKNPASNIMSMTNISSEHGSFTANFATFRHNNFSNTLQRCTYFMFD